jgi:hypothetical protein
MLRVEVYIGRRLIGEATAENVSDLGLISTYECTGRSPASEVTGAPAQDHAFRVAKHVREQSAWALVAKMAGRIADLERQERLRTTS